jgi:hypothetical protein
MVSAADKLRRHKSHVVVKIYRAYPRSPYSQLKMYVFQASQRVIGYVYTPHRLSPNTWTLLDTDWQRKFICGLLRASQTKTQRNRVCSTLATACLERISGLMTLYQRHRQIIIREITFEWSKTTSN